MRELKRRKLEKQFAKLDQTYRDEPESFTTRSPAELKRMMEADALEVSVELIELRDFLNAELVWPGDSPPGYQEGFRKEISQYVSPIISSPDGSDVLAALRSLVGMINAIGLNPPWTVVEKPDKKKSFEYTGPAGPIMHIGGKKFVVYHAMEPYKNDFYANCYTIINQTLLDGSFEKLKRCKECQRVFIADRLSEKFCRPECSKIHFDRDAPNRVKESRKNKNTDKQQPPEKRKSKKQSPVKVKRKRRK